MNDDGLKKRLRNDELNGNILPLMQHEGAVNIDIPTTRSVGNSSMYTLHGDSTHYLSWYNKDNKKRDNDLLNNNNNNRNARDRMKTIARRIIYIAAALVIYIYLVYHFMTPDVIRLTNHYKTNKDKYITPCAAFSSIDSVIAKMSLQDRQNTKRNIGIVTFQQGLDDDIVKLSVENKKLYADRHGYELLVSDHLISILAPNKQPAWAKFPILLKYLESGKYDALLWIDTDAIIMNFTIPVEWILLSSRQHIYSLHNFADIKKTDHEEKDIYFSEDENGVNSGVFIIRNSEWSKWFLKECDRQSSWLSKYPVAVADQGLPDIPFQYEQRAIHYLFDTSIMQRYLESVKIAIDAKGLTSVYQPKARFEKANEVHQHSLILDHCGLNANACEEIKTAIFLFRARSVKHIIKPGLFCDNPYHFGDFIVHLAGKQPASYRNYLIKNFAIAAKTINQ